MERAVITEANVEEYTNADGKVKEICTVVHELDVEEDMLNGGGNLHGGCSGFLIDNCSSVVLLMHTDASGKSYRRTADVSQALNFTLHAPARLGTPLKIISTSIAIGGRTSTVRCEIWDTKNERLVASGVHIKMAPTVRPEARL